MNRVFFDLETTGLSEKSKIFQIGFTNGGTMATEVINVNTSPQDYEPAALNMHKKRQASILENSLKGKYVDEKEALRSFVKKLKENNTTSIAGHNVSSFDLEMVTGKLRKFGLMDELDFINNLDVLDTMDSVNDFMHIVLKDYKDIVLPTYGSEFKFRKGYTRLENIAKGFGLSYAAHTAGADAEVAMRIQDKITNFDGNFNVVEWYKGVVQSSKIDLADTEKFMDMTSKVTTKQASISPERIAEIKQEVNSIRPPKQIHKNAAKPIINKDPALDAFKEDVKNSFYKTKERISKFSAEHLTRRRVAMGAIGVGGLYLYNILTGREDLPKGIRRPEPDAYNEFESIKEHEDFNFPGGRQQSFIANNIINFNKCSTVKIRDQMSRNPCLPFQKTKLGGNSEVNGSRMLRRNK